MRPNHDNLDWPALLRRMDQAVAGAVVGVSLLVIGIYLLLNGAEPGRHIDIDRADPQQVVFLVDINTAQWPELDLLPNIGETIARRIVESREADGPYIDHDDLLRVRGIGPKTLFGIRPYLLAMPAADHVAGP